ncbi:PREDICTED: UDP-glucuronosyltransferase 1-1-like, partial [Acanthisitta chloris]|uniref:UDP-glucuronosyltransferase 1-1-like n=1 Tax=Acanthisitta chloris TaxID=57068 RepID=UPI0004F0FE22
MYSGALTQEESEKEFKAFIKLSFEEGSFLTRFLKVYNGMKRLSDVAFATCENLLQNTELIRYLEESKFDAILTDPVLPCGLIVAGFPLDFTPHTDHMNFLQRVSNQLYHIANSFLCGFMFQPYEKLASEFLHRDVTVLDLLRKGSIWLLRLEFVLEYPRPLMPNIIPIGGVHCAHKKLPQ